MDTFEDEVYTINTSLNERIINLKIMDNVQYLQYEGNIELKELRMHITLQDAYTLVKNCFSQVKDHSVSFGTNTNVLHLDFKAKVGGYMNIGFEIILKQSVIGSDAKLSMKLIEIDKKHKKEMSKIIERIDVIEHNFDTKIKELEKMIELFGNLPTLQSGPINSNIVILDMDSAQYCWLYYKCKKLTLNNSIRPFITENLLSITNNSVEELIITHEFTSLNGLSNMPNLKILNINFAQNTRNNYLIDFVKVLSSYTHTIKQIIIRQHINKEDPTDLQTYCKKNNIELSVQ
jgi:hypothetical protein